MAEGAQIAVRGKGFHAQPESGKLRLYFGINFGIYVGNVGESRGRVGRAVAPNSPTMPLATWFESNRAYQQIHL